MSVTSLISWRKFEFIPTFRKPLSNTITKGDNSHDRERVTLQDY